MFCKNEDAIYLEKNESDFRAPFSRDVDRILYSLAFQRYMDKTQVFSSKDIKEETKPKKESKIDALFKRKEKDK